VNQDSNYNFDPMTGQPIQQQPVQQNNQKISNTKKNKLIVILFIVLVILAVGLIVYLVGRNKMDKDLNTENYYNSVENNADDMEIDTDVIDTENSDEVMDVVYDKDGSFLMEIANVYVNDNDNTVVSGIINRGTIRVGDTVEIVGLNNEIKTSIVNGIEILEQVKDEVLAGDTVEIILKDVVSEEIKIGQVLAAPNSIGSTNKFDADVYVLTKQEGGRHTPFFSNYKPKVCFRTSSFTGTITLPDGIEMVMPGDDVIFTVTLELSVAMEVGTKFTIKEGGRIIATGTVTKLY
jgi:elongation factor Tu